MKAFIDGFLGNSFSKEAFKSDQQRLTDEMTQAFYRREYDTVDLLARQGAVFTDEMLHVAMKMKDPQLVLRCLHGGVKASEQERDAVQNMIEKAATPRL